MLPSLFERAHAHLFSGIRGHEQEESIEATELPCAYDSVRFPSCPAICHVDMIVVAAGSNLKMGSWGACNSPLADVLVPARKTRGLSTQGATALSEFTRAC